MIFYVFSRPLDAFKYTNKNILWGAKKSYWAARYNPWLNPLKKLRFKCGVCTLHVFPKKQHLKTHDVTKYFGGISDLVDETYTALDFYVVECTVLSLIYPPTFYCPAPFRKKSSTFSILRKWANLSSFQVLHFYGGSDNESGTTVNGFSFCTWKAKKNFGFTLFWLGCRLYVRMAIRVVKKKRIRAFLWSLGLLLSIKNIIGSSSTCRMKLWKLFQTSFCAIKTW